jgi:hypothetical protein
VYAFVQKGVADENLRQAKIAQAEAEKQKKLADASAIEATKAAQLAEEQRKLAVAAAEEARKAQALAEEQRKLAVANEEKAKINEEKAKKAQAFAELKRQEADKATKQAVEAKLEADRQRYLALAKAISLKSSQLNDKELRALLAQQGFNYNAKYGGYEFDNDVYNGLYGALNANNDPMTNSLNGHTSAARALVTSVKNDAIYSGGSDGRIILWTEAKDGTWKGDTLSKFVNPGEKIPFYQIYSMDISNDGNYLAAGGLYSADRSANYVYLFDLRNPSAEPKKIYGFVSDVENISFTPDNQGFFARANSGKSIMYSDLTSAKEIINTSKEKITSIDLSPYGTKLAGGGVNGNLYIWDVKNNFAANTYPILSGSTNDILTVAYSPKGTDVIVGGELGELRIITAAGVHRKTLPGHTSHIEQIRFSHSGKFMATSSKDKTIRLWNWDDLNKTPQVFSDHDWVWSMAFSPDDNQIMAGIHSIISNIPKDGKEDIDYTIHSWPTKITAMSSKLCTYIKKNMSKDNWNQYVDEDVPYQNTCANLPANNK